MTWPLPETFLVGLCTGLGWGLIIGMLVMSTLLTAARGER